MEIKQILIFLGIVLVLFLITNFIMYQMAKSICEESETKPARYVYVGLFGTRQIIETTPENADTYAKVCIKTGEPKFWSISENLQYLVEKTREAD